MKTNRFVSLLIVLAMLCTMIVSCGEKALADVPTADLLDAVMVHFAENAENVDIYRSGAGEEDEGYLDPGLAGQIFLGEYGAALTEDGVITEYAHAIPSALFAFEIDIFKAADKGAADTIADMLQTRFEIKSALREQIKHYLGTEPNSANELKAIDSIEIWQIGNYVLLIATHNNAAVKNTVSTLLGAEANAVETTASAETEAATETVTEPVDPVEQAAEDGFTLTTVSHSAPTRVVLGGRCAEGAKIHVEGGLRDYVANTDYTSWMVEVEIGETGESLLYLCQELDGKMTVPLTVEVGRNDAADLTYHGDFVPIMGDSFQGMFMQQIPDWMGTNLLSDKEKERVAKAVKEKVRFCEYNDIELIYMVVPNQCLLYPEIMDEERFPRSTADVTLYEQFAQIAKEAGATVLDVYSVFEEHKYDEFKLFHKTDSHWSEYGAYWGYHTLMTEIAKKFPDAAPLEIEGNMRFYTQEVEAGDMMTYFGIENHLVPETATFVEWLIDCPNRIEFYKPNRVENENSVISKARTVTNPNAKGKNMPSVMFIRDSYSFGIHSFINQSFSKIYWNSTWDYQFKKNDIKKAKVDYLVYIISEKNMRSILY
ncbi:MAG: hypothetical protein IKZ09_12785 [Clostridia bacterium]|nr:hypothetical protein [Clostridia bacterium]